MEFHRRSLLPRELTTESFRVQFAHDNWVLKLATNVESLDTYGQPSNI